MSGVVTVADLRRHMAEPANADAAHVARGRLLDAVLLVGIGELQAYVTLREGRVTEIEPGPKPLRTVSLAIRAEPQVWLAFWQSVPRPGCHDILALAKAGHMTIEGDVRLLMTHLRVVKDLLAKPRGRLVAADG